VIKLSKINVVVKNDKWDIVCLNRPITNKYLKLSLDCQIRRFISRFYKNCSFVSILILHNSTFSYPRYWISKILRSLWRFNVTHGLQLGKLQLTFIANLLFHHTTGLTSGYLIPIIAFKDNQGVRSCFLSPLCLEKRVIPIPYTWYLVSCLLSLCLQRPFETRWKNIFFLSNLTFPASFD